MVLEVVETGPRRLSHTKVRRFPLVLDLLRATHLGPSLVVTGLTSALAVANGLGAGSLLVGCAVLAGQFSVGWGNDWLDRERDRAALRTDKPIATGAVRERTVLRAALGAVVVCAVLSLPLGLSAAAVHLLAVGIGWSYNLGLKRTAASVVPYAAAFGLLPVFVSRAGGGATPAWTIVAAALLGAGAHFTNTLPDFERDALTGVRGLPHRVGERGSALIGALLLGAGAAVAAAGQGGPGVLPDVGLTALVACAALVLAVLVVAWRDASRAAFTLSMAAAGAVVVLLVSAGPVLR
jgi:4-hydroxybenzoate polyprenyltransferase